MSARTSILKPLADGKYQARVWDDYRQPLAGYTSKRFAKRGEAVAWIKATEGALSRGVRTENARNRATVGAETARWLELRKPLVSPGTWARDERDCRLKLVPALGAKPVTDLRVSDVTAWLNALAAAPSSAETVNLALSSLRLILDQCVADGLIVTNVARAAKRLKPPRVARDTVRQAMPLATIDALREAMPPVLRIGITLGLGLGLRAGELCGLTIDRIDYLRGTARIDRQWTRYGESGRYGFAEPKHGSFRTVPMTPALLEAVNAHIAEHGLGEGGAILHRANGGMMPAQYWWDVFATALGKLGLARGTWSPHDLRHAFGSYQLAAGQRETRVAGWMGHANLATFLKVYAHDVASDEPPADIEAMPRPAVHAAAAKSAHSVHKAGPGRALRAV